MTRRFYASRFTHHVSRITNHSPMHLRLAFIGFGNVARAFARILSLRASQLAQDYDLRFSTTAIATARHGCIVSSDGIDLSKAVACIESGAELTELHDSLSVTDSAALIEICDADLLFETTPLNPLSGEPAIAHIRSALTRGIHVVTANKGPIAFAYRDLKSLAFQHGAGFRFEGTVMDGTPIFNLVESCLPGTRVLGFSGVLNSTTNLILAGMESGRSFEDSLKEAQHRGIAEADADYDIDGWDAAVKAVALANVLMDSDSRPSDVNREGIRGIKIKDLTAAAASGMAVRLVARGKQTGDGVKLTVAPEEVPLASVFGSVRGTSNALVLETDLMGEIAIVETDPGVEQTAYALLSDMIRVKQRNEDE